MKNNTNIWYHRLRIAARTQNMPYTIHNSSETEATMYIIFLFNIHTRPSSWRFFSLLAEQSRLDYLSVGDPNKGPRTCAVTEIPTTHPCLVLRRFRQHILVRSCADSDNTSLSGLAQIIFFARQCTFLRKFMVVSWQCFYGCVGAMHLWSCRGYASMVVSW